MKLSPECPHRSMEPTADEIEDGKRIRYWSCPIKLVHKSVLHWYNQYEYEMEQGSNITYNKRPKRYLLMRSYYKSKYAEYARIVSMRRIRGG